MAVGTIQHAHQLDLLHMTQQQIEAHVIHMDLLCLMVLTNSIRPDSEDTISQLQHGCAQSQLLCTLCCAMLCYAMLCYAMLCYAMLCCAVLCYAMLCYAMLCYAMLCYAMLCCAALCCAYPWPSVPCYAFVIYCALASHTAAPGFCRLCQAIVSQSC